MRIGLDMDGVLAAFHPAYEECVVSYANGVDLFPKRYPEALPPTWDWPQHYGYTDDVVEQVWTHIKNSETFWLSLSSVPGAWKLAEYLRLKMDELYFITDRPGSTAQAQTATWLNSVLGFDNPSVIISRRGKGICARALSLDVYVDDKYENVLDVQTQSPETVALCIDYPYNQGPGIKHRIKRTSDVVSFLERLRHGTPDTVDAPTDSHNV